MYRGQYIIYKDECNTDIDGFDRQSFGQFFIYSHSSLNITIHQNSDVAIALLGFIIDPFKPEATNEQIVHELIECSTSADGFFQKIHALSGRFVTLVRIKENYFVSGDACHYRQILHSQTNHPFAITSSPRLYLDFFGLDTVIDREKQMLINHPLFYSRENSWYGDGTEDDRLVKLLPNHFLDISRQQVKRVPVPQMNILSEEETVNHVSDILRGTFKALTHRYKLIQALTAGWDTRLLLAASKEYKDQIEYYVFDRQDKKGPKSADARAAFNLSQSLGLNFKTINPEPLAEYFLQRFSREHIIPRILPKTANIQYYYNQGYSKDVMSVSGNCAGIYKHPYGYNKGKVTLDHLLVFSGYHDEIPYIRKQIEWWYKGSEDYARELNVSLLDLFNWEQRVGNWGSVFPFEKDFAIEEVSPFNNRMLLLCMLKVNPLKRISPGFVFLKQIISHLWKETLSEPLNQDTNPLWKVIKGHTQFKYLTIKLRFILLKKRKLRKYMKASAVY